MLCKYKIDIVLGVFRFEKMRENVAKKYAKTCYVLALFPYTLESFVFNEDLLFRHAFYWEEMLLPSSEHIAL